jgi:DNA polymerase III epsilon subunit-like protein
MCFPASPSILVVEAETTGPSAHLHGLVEIGAVWLSGPREGEEFQVQCFPRPEALIDVEAIAINGCDWLESSDVLSEADAVQSFLDWVNAPTVLMAGMNPYFDRLFLLKAFDHAWHGREASKPKFPFPHRTLDMHSLAISYAIAQGYKIPDKGLYTDTILEMLGLPPEPKPHRAINGARAEAEALRILLGLPNILPTL